MIQELQLKCEKLQDEHQQIIKQLTQLRQIALEKQQELQKLQNFIKIIDSQSKPIRDQVATIQNIVEDIEDTTKREAIQQSVTQLEELMISQIIELTNGKKVKKAQNRKVTNENDQNTINLRKRTQKQLVEITSETSDSESIEPIKVQRKKIKSNAEVMEKANCLINDIFNFN